jgi:spore coat polysaccharide biosynthesis predicted glycosyltransferase SpsG/ribosomal protein S18 acetylase RimI-like enzyme
MDRRIAVEGGDVADLVGDADQIRDREALLERAVLGGWVVLDVYDFAAQAEDALRSRACRILSIDDYGAREYVSADLLLNQNTSADGIAYDHGPETIPLRGPRFALLRKAFRRELRKPRTEKKGGVLVIFGGSDPAGLTARTLSALASLKEPPPVGVAICGPLTTGSENIRKVVTQLGAGWSVEMNASDATVAATLSNADVAVSACGTTVWELAAFGIPTLALSVAENQRLVLSSLAAIGAVSDGGSSSGFREEKFAACFDQFRQGTDNLRRMREIGRAMVDGQGASRVVDAMLAVDERGEPTLRLATPEDTFLLWRWANDPAARSQSFQSEPIGWDEHRHWFEQRLRSEASRIYVLEWKTIPVGIVRYDRVEGSRARISFSVDRDFRGRGFGLKLIQLSRPQASRDLSVEAFEAETLPGNVPSQRVFRRAGFLEQATAQGTSGRVRFLFDPLRDERMRT